MWASLVAQTVKTSACNVGNLGLILGLGRSPGGKQGKPLQYSCLENPSGQRSLVGHRTHRVGHDRATNAPHLVHVQGMAFHLDFKEKAT